MTPDQNKKNNEWLHLFRIGVMIFITFVCCILFFFLLFKFQGFTDIWSKVMSALNPIIIGLVLAYLMNPIMKFFEKYIKKFFIARGMEKKTANKWSRGIAIGCTVIVLAVAIAALIAAVVPSLISSISTLVSTLPKDVEDFIKKIQEGNFGDSEAAKIFSNFLTNFTDKIEDWAQKTLLPQAQKYLMQITGGVISVVKGLVNFIIGIVVMIYAMGIQETLTGQAKKIVYAIFKPVRANVIIKVVRKTDSIFGGFITGKILDSFIIGLICYIGCVILRIPSAMLVAVIVGITNIIPAFGPFIGAVPSLFLVVIQSPIHALYLIIFIVILQQVDGNIIGPKILGSSTGLSTFWVMFAILVFGGLFGFLGMLVGVPIMGVIYYIIKEIVNYILKKRNLSTKTEEYVHLQTVDKDTNEMMYSEKSETKEDKKEEKEDKKEVKKH